MDPPVPAKKKRLGPKKAYLHRLESNSNDDEDFSDSPQAAGEMNSLRRQHTDSFSAISLPDDLRLSFSEIEDSSLQLDDLDFNCSPSVCESASQGLREDASDKMLTKLTSVNSSATSKSPLIQSEFSLNSNYSVPNNDDLNNGFFHDMAKSNCASSNVDKTSTSKMMSYFHMKSEQGKESLGDGEQSGSSWPSQSGWDLPHSSQDPQVSTIGSSGDGIMKKQGKVRRTSKNKHTLNMACQVCGDMAAGFYCGAYICEACKKFYMRAFKQDKLKYACLRDKQCTITKESRVQCQYCRFQKCIKLNMYCPKQGEGESTKDVPMSDIPCKVCTAPSSGFHFGAITCEGCKGFFRRMAKEREPEKYQCNKKGLCEINMITRNLCKACRYQQCLKVGMSVEGSRIGRQPNSVKHAITMEVRNVKVETQSCDTSPPPPPTSAPVMVKEEPISFSELLPDDGKNDGDNMDDLLWDDWSNNDEQADNSVMDNFSDPKNKPIDVSNVSEGSSSPSELVALPQPAFLYKSAHKQNQLMALHQNQKAAPPWLPKPPQLMSWSQNMTHPLSSTIWTSINKTKSASSSAATSPQAFLSTTLPSSSPSNYSLSPPAFSNRLSHSLPTPVSSAPPQFNTHQHTPSHTPLSQTNFPFNSPQVSPTHYQSYTNTAQTKTTSAYSSPPPPVYSSQKSQPSNWTSTVVSAPSNYSSFPNSWQQTPTTSHPSAILQSPRTPSTSTSHQPLMPVSKDDSNVPVLPGPKIKIQVPMTDTSSLLPEAFRRENGGDLNAAYVEKMNEFIFRIVEAGKVLQLLNYRVFDSDLSPTPSMNVDEIKAQFESKYMDPKAGNQITSKADMSMFSSRESTWNYMMTNFHHNTYITIRFAKMVPGFKTLSLNDQEKLIKSSIYPIELLNMSKVFDPLTKRYNYFTYTLEEEQIMMDQFPMLRVFQEHFLHVGEMVTSFGFDDEEFALLSALLLFPAEIPGLENPPAVEELQNEVLCALQYYEEKHFADGMTRYGVLLVRVAELVQCLLQHNLAIGLLLNNNPTIKVPQLFHELIIESIKEGQPK